MSYILGALRKAEQERKGDAAQDINEWDSKEWNSVEASSGMSRGMKVVIGVILLLLASIFGALWVLVGEVSRSENPVASEPKNMGEDPGLIQLDISPLPDEAESAFAEEDGLIVLEPGKPIVVGNTKSNTPQIPEISGHLYFSANESLSRIFADAGSYRVGDVFEDGLELISISENQAVFEWRGEHYEVSLKQ